MNDLVRLRDVGRGADGLWEESPLAVSPDGRTVAFHVRQADAESNSYCQALLAVPLDQPSPRARALDHGGDLLKGTMSLRGLAAIPLGTAKTIVPRWSPDGSMVGYLKATKGPAQLWLVSADGGGARQATSLDADVTDFRWDSGGTRIFIATRPALDAGKKAIANEALSGFYFDNRFSPAIRSRPFVREPVPTIWLALDPATGVVTPLSNEERALLDEANRDPRLSTGSARRRDGNVVWASAEEGRYGAPRTLHRSAPDGSITSCVSSECEGVLDFGWTDMPDTLWYVRSEGAAFEEMALYTWRPGDAPVRKYGVAGVLSGCIGAGADIVCIAESSARPQGLLRISAATGAHSVILDLNPEFRSIRLGRVERLRATNKYGVSAFADLVLPLGHRAGDRHPLVVVQYQSRGFLRGGTGDEAPIFALAQQGFAVLSFNRPKDYYVDPAPTWTDYLRAVMHDRIDRRNILDSLDQLIDKAIASGVVDEGRIGIWGLSDGASTVQYALLNGRHKFAAVSLASCCEDPGTFELLGGPVLQDFMRAAGYPSWGGDKDPWAAYSLARNADRVSAPFLLQLADSEYIKSLEMASALRDLGRPVEMFVFPDERHIKWQPAHRLAIYRRNIQWFDFWLNGLEAKEPIYSEQYLRWREMRATRTPIND